MLYVRAQQTASTIHVFLSCSFQHRFKVRGSGSARFDSDIDVLFGTSIDI